jgi:uncharacterized protein
MEPFPEPEPLSEDELDRLQEFLEEWGHGMNIEEMDGFFSALIAGPEAVTPSQYLPEVFGTDPKEGARFEVMEEAQWVLSLMMRHWNAIAATLAKGELHRPLLLQTSDGVAKGYGWARGFIEGMQFSRGEWEALVRDGENGGCLIPMLMLWHEHDEDPAQRTQPISPQQREKVFAEIPGALTFAYQHFRERRKAGAGIPPLRTLPSSIKIGQRQARPNDPCPCGSGKEYKRCCGGTTIQ